MTTVSKYLYCSQLMYDKIPLPEGNVNEYSQFQGCSGDRSRECSRDGCWQEDRRLGAVRMILGN